MKRLMGGALLTFLASGICSTSYADEEKAAEEKIRSVMAEMDFNREECRSNLSVFLHDVCAGITKAHVEEQLGEPIKCESDKMLSLCTYSRASGLAGGHTKVFFILDRAFQIQMHVPNTNEFNRGMGDSFAKAWAEHVSLQQFGVVSFKDGVDYMYYDPLSNSGEKEITVSWGNTAFAGYFEVYPRY